MRAGLVSYLAWWGPYAAGVLAVVYSIILRTLDNGEPSDPVPSNFILMPLTMTLLLLGVGMVLIGILLPMPDVSWRYGMAFFVGGLTVLAAFLYSRWRSGSVFIFASDAFFGAGLAVLVMALLRNYFRDAPMLYLLIAALGAYLAVAMLYYGRSSGSWICVRTAALGLMVKAGAVAMGVYRYPKSSMGSLLAVDAGALVLVLSIIASLIVLWGRRSILRSIIAPILAVLGVWLLSGLLGRVILDEPDAGLCVLAGSVAVWLIYVLSVNSGGLFNDDEAVLMGSTEAGLLAALVAIACVAISLRLLGGYGAALAAVGGLASFPFVYLLIDRTQTGGPDREIANGGAGLVAALAAVAFIRVFAEGTGGTGTQVNLFESYAIVGLILGGVLSIAQMSLAQGWCREHDSTLLCTSRGIATIVLGVAAVLAAAYFWRYEAMIGVMLGVCAGLFFMIAASPFFRKPAGGAELALGLPLFTAVIVPPLLAHTINLTRDQKVAVMAWSLGAVAVVIIVSSVLRIRRLRE